MRSEGSGWRLDQKRTRMWRVWNVALIQQMMKLLSHCSVFWNQNQSVRSSERFVRNVVFMRWHDRALCCWPCRTRVHLSSSNPKRDVLTSNTEWGWGTGQWAAAGPHHNSHCVIEKHVSYFHSSSPNIHLEPEPRLLLLSPLFFGVNSQMGIFFPQPKNSIYEMF